MKKGLVFFGVVVCHRPVIGDEVVNTQVYRLAYQRT